MPATELRVHLGEALKALETEDLLIEKGGVLVAVLTPYERSTAREEDDSMRTEYERSLSKRANPNGIARTLAAMDRGWVGIDADELEANIEKWRAEGASARSFTLDDDRDDEGDDDGEASSGQQYLYRHAPPDATLHVAEGSRSEWDA